LIQSTTLQYLRRSITSDLSEPRHILINLSERAHATLIPKLHHLLVEHASRHHRRVYPHGLRVHSNNLNPIPHWHAGAQIAALNWQTFDRGVQLNEAMFVGSPGWVLKPPELLPGFEEHEDVPRKKTKLVCDIVGLSSRT
jgi:phosphatidylinositol phospholipase C, delta